MSQSQPFYRPIEGYSPKKTIKPVNFSYLAAAATKVTLAGDFNDWDPQSLPMKRQADGGWVLQVPLSAGHHHYWFLVDGKPTLDPRAQGIARNQNNEKVSLIAVS